METVELMTILAQGEDSYNQFKRDVPNVNALAAEMVAFSNGQGGKIIIGVDDDGQIFGLDTEDIKQLKKDVSNAASQIVRPIINPTTQTMTIDDKFVVVIDIVPGINKPYQDKNGVFWVKSGADKRKATAREEIQRLFQMSNLLHADEVPANGLGLADLDQEYFDAFFKKRYGESREDQDISLGQTITNLNLGDGNVLNLAGALLFAKNPSTRLPAFIVKAGSFPGTDISGIDYSDSKDITGKLGDVFQQTISFILGNIRHVQGEQGVNSLGEPEIARITLEELVANALIHRDYFISAPIRVFVLSDRVEIISPGHLPNNLTIENIKAGNSNTRNPVLASFANQILPYRGYGAGILRALKYHPDIEFVDDHDGNLFICRIMRTSTAES
ncbi:MAG: putative DNA binding domain-containing protein [Desulfobulbaceae bacterium]|nr:putative DNA binding domain-containing protein [Desulfobulbaceae bacterium]